VRNRRRQQVDLKHGLIAATIARHPREFVGVVMATVATLAIFVNALFLQSGPHPAPIFATRPFMHHHAAAPLQHPHPVVPTPPPSGEESARSQAQTVGDIQRALAARGFYQGAVDGIWGNKTDAAVREFAQAAHLKLDPAPGESLLRAITASNVKAPGAAAAPARKDPIAALIAFPKPVVAPSKPVNAPSKPEAASPKRVLQIQHALADFGYGQIKPTGVLDDDTRAAIEKFERDRHLPVDGQVSERFVRELAVMTGRSLE
jgi:peptidoglycan hydrolase-like protein with peptidoglycan-binding domain